MAMALKKCKKLELGPTILEINIRFLKELRFQDEIMIKTTMREYKNKIGKLSQKIMRNDDMCCEAEYTLALFDMKARKLVLPTQEWLTAVGVKE